MNTFSALLRTMRPKQWTKNLLLFAALLFAKEFMNTEAIGSVLVAFVSFCVLSGTVYMVNDVADLEQDRRHPKKRHRPLASGALSPTTAIVAAGLLAPIAVAGCFFVNTGTGLVAVGYLGLTLSYHFLLKHVVILDALTVAGGFVLRAVAGAEAIKVEISPWLLMCTLLLALFLSFTKRRQEIVSLDENAATTRRILSEYTPEMLDQMIAIVTASTLMSYCLYTISERTVGEVGSRDLIFTIPLVIYGIFRYMYLVHRHGEGEAPDRVLLTDIPLLCTVALYVVVVALVFAMAGGALGGPLLPETPSG